MFTLSKLAWALLMPKSIVALLAVAGCAAFLLGRLRAAAAWMAAAFALAVALTFSPLGRVMLMALEQRFPVRSEVLKPVEGIIVLGGVMSRAAMANQVRAPPPPRIATLIALSRAHPDALLLFSGGSGELDGSGAIESIWVKRWLLDADVDERRLLLETESRNTAENAFFSRQMLPDARGRWILITSALHMPRAVGTFRAHGWDVVPWPVDHISPPELVWKRPLFTSEAEVLITMAWREALGLAAYRLKGWTNTLLPAP